MARTPGSFPIPTPSTASDPADLTIYNEDINEIRSRIVGLMGPGADSYNTSYSSTAAAKDIELVRLENFSRLYSDINRVYKHQTGTNLNFSSASSGSQITADFLNNLYAASGTVIDVNNKYNAYYSTNPANGYTNQLVVERTNNSLRSGSWSGVVANVVVVNWVNSDYATYHFNLGGRHYAEITYSGGSSQDDLDLTSFIDTVNATISAYYTRVNWLSGTVTHSVSSDGYLAELTIEKTGSGTSLTFTLTITPPVGKTYDVVLGWDIVNMKSTDAIVAPAYTSSQFNKVLVVAASNTSFSLNAGENSELRTMTISNGSGSDTITVTGFNLSNNGATAYVAGVGTNFSVNNIIAPLTLPFTIPPASSVQVKVFYARPTKSTEGLGTFNNSIVVNSTADYGLMHLDTTVAVTAPDLSIGVQVVNVGDLYTYSDWTSDTNLRAIGIRIANTLYLSNSDFGLVDGIRRYGLYRRPDFQGLNYWATVCRDSYSGNEANSAFISSFFRSINPSGSDLSRSLTNNKSFDTGWGYGDFYDRTQSLEAVSDLLPKNYRFLIIPQFGSVSSFSSALSNYKFNSVGDSSLSSVFTKNDNRSSDGPEVTFYPSGVENAGAYSATLTVTAQGRDLRGNAVTVTGTADVLINVTSLADRNYMTWVSARSNNNSVVGISYDRIGGTNYVTVGLGMGTDNAAEAGSINASLVDPSRLGINGDSMFGSGFPFYRVTYGTWNSLMNTYGVWFTNSGVPQTPFQRLYRTYTFTAPVSGTYTYEFAVDDRGGFAIDGSIILTDDSESFRAGREKTGSFYLASGTHTITINAQNNSRVSSGNPGAVALVIRSPSNLITWSTLEPVRAVPPYLYWAEVYRVPLTNNVAGTYQIRDYIVKNSFLANKNSSSGNTYSAYFGSPGTASAGSYMTLTHDGFGNVGITFNNVSTYPDDSRTIIGLAYAKYYYSEEGYRVSNLETKQPDGLTNILTGITRTGVTTARVAIPIPAPDTSTPIYDGGGGGWDGTPGDPTDPGDPGDDGFGDTEGSGNDGGDNGAGSDAGDSDGGFGDTAGSGNDGGDNGAGDSGGDSGGE